MYTMFAMAFKRTGDTQYKIGVLSSMQNLQYGDQDYSLPFIQWALQG